MAVYEGWKGTPLQRFWEKIEVVDGHWMWRGALNGDGYGMFRPVSGRTMVRTHRWAYAQFVAPISGEIDHLCNVRACCFPGHLRDTTRDENMLRTRRTHCKHGHEFTPENTYVFHDKKRNLDIRRCRQCGADATRKYLARKKED